MKDLKIFEKLAEVGISYVIKRLKRKFKKNFVAFIVYGSYATEEFTLNSDVDTLAIFKKNITEVDSWLYNFARNELYNWLSKESRSKILGKNKPNIAIYPEKLSIFKKKLCEGDPLTLDIIQFGKLYYPYYSENPIYFFQIKTKRPSKKKFMKNVFEKEVRRLLVSYTRLFIKKCLLVGRRLYFLEEKRHLKKTKVSKAFDKKFKSISKKASLEKINSYLSRNPDDLKIEELIKIIYKCNQFLLLTKKYNSSKRIS